MFEGQNIKIKPINIFNKDNNIFLSLIDKNIVYVTIGNLTQELIFHSISCLRYKNHNIFEAEKNNLLNQSFKDYIISRKCQENDLNAQNLINEKDNNDPEIGQFLRIQKKMNNSNINKINGKKSVSPKIGEKTLVEKSEGNNKIFYSKVKINNQNEKKIILSNSSIGRSRTPKNTVNTQNNLNKNFQINFNNLDQIQEESNKVPRNANPNLQNKGTNSNKNNLKEQQQKDLLLQQKLKNLQNELDKNFLLINKYKNEDSKNKQLIAQLRKENNNLMEKDKKNQE
jgi:hypothetical protein